MSIKYEHCSLSCSYPLLCGRATAAFSHFLHYTKLRLVTSKRLLVLPKMSGFTMKHDIRTSKDDNLFI